MEQIKNKKQKPSVNQLDWCQVELTEDEEVVCGDLLRGEGGHLAVVEAGGEDAGLVDPHHLGGHQTPGGVGQQVFCPHLGPAIPIESKSL